MICAGGGYDRGLCISMEWLAQHWIDLAFYSALSAFILLWVVVRLIRKRRSGAEEEVI